MAAHAEGWPQNGDFRRERVFGKLIRGYKAETAIAYSPPVVAEAVAPEPAAAMTQEAITADSHLAALYLDPVLAEKFGQEVAIELWESDGQLLD